MWKASKGGKLCAIKSIKLSKKDAMKTAEMEKSLVTTKFFFIFLIDLLARLSCPFVIDYSDAFRYLDFLFFWKKFFL